MERTEGLNILDAAGNAVAKVVCLVMSRDKKECSPEEEMFTDYLSFPWPYADGSMARLEVNRVLEEIPHEAPGVEGEALGAFINEAWRVLEPGGDLALTAATIEGPDAFQRPTARRYFVFPQSFSFFGRFPEEVPGTPQYEQKQGDIGRVKDNLAFEISRSGEDSPDVGKLRTILGQYEAPLYGDARNHEDYGIKNRFDIVDGGVDIRGIAHLTLRKPK